MATVPRFFDAPEGSFFLFGPRGNGKSAWLRERYPDALWIDLLEPQAPPGGVDVLAGRALLRFLHPFMAAELGARCEFR